AGRDRRPRAEGEPAGFDVGAAGKGVGGVAEDQCPQAGLDEAADEDTVSDRPRPGQGGAVLHADGATIIVGVHATDGGAAVGAVGRVSPGQQKGAPAGTENSSEVQVACGIRRRPDRAVDTTGAGIADRGNGEDALVTG